MTERRVNVLLDASAVVVYTSGDAIGVGEVVAEVADEGLAFGISVPCLAVATLDVHDARLLELLLAHPACRIVSDGVAAWRQIAAVMTIVGRYDLSSAVVHAYKLDVQILTRRPDLYEGLPDGGPVIEV